MGESVASKKTITLSLFPSFKLPGKGANAAEEAIETMLFVLKQLIN